MGKQKYKQKQNPPSAYVLLSGAWYNFHGFVDRFSGKWNTLIGPRQEENLLSFIAESMVVRCAFSPAPLAEQTLSNDAKRSFLWPGASERIALHAAHIFVTVVPGIREKKDAIAAHRLLSKTVSALLEADNAIGVWLSPGVLEKNHYVKTAKALIGDALPTDLWVHIDAWENSDGLSLATFGMNKFDKPEFEIIESKKNFIDCYYHLKQIVEYTIRQNAAVRNGTISAGETATSKISLSKGVFASGTTAKIDY